MLEVKFARFIILTFPLELREDSRQTKQTVSVLLSQRSSLTLTTLTSNFLRLRCRTCPAGRDPIQIFRALKKGFCAERKSKKAFLLLFFLTQEERKESPDFFFFLLKEVF